MKILAFLLLATVASAVPRAELVAEVFSQQRFDCGWRLHNRCAHNQ
jgi:hypothetical protein